MFRVYIFLLKLKGQSALEEEKEDIRVESPDLSDETPGPRAISHRQDVKVVVHAKFEGQTFASAICGTEYFTLEEE